MPPSPSKNCSIETLNFALWLLSVSVYFPLHSALLLLLQMVLLALNSSRHRISATTFVYWPGIRQQPNSFCILVRRGLLRSTASTIASSCLVVAPSFRWVYTICQVAKLNSWINNLYITKTRATQWQIKKNLPGILVLIASFE